MNKSKLIATSAIATVMTATAAQAELSISGGMAGWWLTGDSITSVNRQWNTESVNVTYSDTLDNGMGVSVTANVGETGATVRGWGSDSAQDVNYTMTISSDMGTLSFGDQIASAADRGDNIISMSLQECCTWAATLPDGMGGANGVYADGDNATGDSNEGIEYSSPSLNGWTIRLSHSPTAANASESAEDSNGASVSGAIGPVSVSAGMNSQGHDGTNDGYDSTYGAASIGLGSMTVSAGMFEGGGNRADATVLVVDMPIMGMSGKATYVDLDDTGANYDDSGYRLGLSKSLGAASFSVEYDNADTASGDAGEVETWRVGYALYF
tara:strand:- start:72 stop:1046 length:975 start_codon:yes stop_codon:yes gene_type:complete